MEAKRNLCDVFGEDAVTARTCQRWFPKIRSGDFSLKDEPRSGRPSDVNDEVLRSMIRTNPTLTSTEVGFKLGIHQTTALDHIKRFPSRSASSKPTGSHNHRSPTSKPMNHQDSSRSRHTYSNSSPMSNVYLRIKSKSTEINDESYTVLNSTTLVVKKTENADRKFTFTRIFDSDSSQADLFDHSVQQQVINFLLGESSTIVACGASNSGKTYTLYGTPESPGIIPRTIEFLFSAVNYTLVPWYKVTDDNQIVALDEYERAQEMELKTSIIKSSAIGKDEYVQALLSLDNSTPVVSKSQDREVHGSQSMSCIWLSFAEIYIDNVYDLLTVQDQDRSPLRMTTRKDGSTYVKGLKFVHVTTSLEACQLLIYAQSRMTVASTSLNATSSRSHVLSTVRLLKYEKENAVNEVQVSTLTFCDVASSGRFKRSEDTRMSLLESRSIKNSLLVLGRCLKSVCSSYSSGDQAVGPFRESKLTRVLQKALTGRESISFVVTIDTGDNFSPETLGALNISVIAKRLGVELRELKRGYASETPRSPNTTLSSVIARTLGNHLVVTGNPEEYEILKRQTEEPLSSITARTPGNPEEYETLKRQTEELTKEVVTLRTALSKYEGQTSVKCLRQSKHDLFLDYKDLQEQNERLVEALENFKSDRLNHELEIRQELSNQYTNIIEELETSWKKRAQEIEDQGQDLLQWSVNQIQTFYKERIDNIMHNRKRKRCDSGDSADETRSICEELETENALITSKMVVLKEKVRSLKSENELLSTDRNKCSFDLALVRQKLKDFHDTFRVHFPELLLNVDKNDSVRLVDRLKHMSDAKTKNIEMLESDLCETKDNCVRIIFESTKIEKELSEMRVALEETSARAKYLENELFKKINFTNSLKMQLRLVKKELAETRECQSSNDKSRSVDDSIRKSSSTCDNDFFCGDDIDDVELITQAHVDTKMENYFNFESKKSSKKMSLNDSDTKMEHYFNFDSKKSLKKMSSNDSDTKMEHYFNFDSKKSSKKMSLNDSDADMSAYFGNIESIDRTILRSCDGSMKEDSGIDSSCRSRRSTSVSDSLMIQEMKEKCTQTSLEDDDIRMCERMEQLKAENANLKAQQREENLQIVKLSEQVNNMKGIIRTLTEVLEISNSEIAEYKEKLMIREAEIEKLMEDNNRLIVEVDAGKCEQRNMVENEHYNSKRLACVENQLAVLLEELEASERVSKIEKLEKALEPNETNDKMAEEQSDLFKVQQLHEKVNEPETVLEKCQEKNNYRERSQEHLETQSMLEMKLKCLSTEIQRRDHELISLKMEISDATLSNNEQVKSVSERIDISKESMYSMRAELACSEEIRKYQERLSKDEVSNLNLRLNAFIASTAFLNQIRMENEGKKEEIERLKVQLLEKEREIGLFKKHRVAMINKYECLVGTLRSQIDKKKTQLTKLKKLFLSNASRKHLKFANKKCRKFKVSQLPGLVKGRSSVWLSQISRTVDHKESAALFSRCSIAKQSYAQSLSSYTSDENKMFDVSSMHNTEESSLTESSSGLNNSNAEVRQTQSDASDCSEVHCRCGIGFRDARRQGRMSGWMKLRRTEPSCQLTGGHGCVNTDDSETDT